MGNVRPEISKKNMYWIEKEKYYELLHFCRQYDSFKQELNSIYGAYPDLNWEERVDSNDISDSAAKAAEKAIKLHDKINMIKSCALKADPQLCKWILMGVTKDYSYGYLTMKLQMPCSKDTYYDRYRKFFWLLSEKR